MVQKPPAGSPHPGRAGSPTRVQLAQCRNVGGEVQRPALAFAGVAEDPNGVAVGRGHSSLERVVDSVIMANSFHEADGPRDRVERVVGEPEGECQEEQGFESVDPSMSGYRVGSTAITGSRLVL